MKIGDLYPKNGERKTGPNGRGEVKATYPYCDEDGELLFEVLRYEPKDFRQRRPDGEGGYIWSLGDVRRVLYRLPDVIRADPAMPVYVVEGEKDADRLRGLGLVATCNPGGAGKWRSEYAEALEGRTVIVIPDNDDPGRRHAEAVARSLHGKAASVRVLTLPGLPGKGDVSDWLDRGGTRDDLEGLARNAREYAPKRDPLPVLCTAAELFDQPSVPWLVEDIVPVQSGVVLYGPPDTGKTFIVLDIGLHVATGQEWLGMYDVGQGNVVYVAGEGGRQIMRRVRAWTRWKGLDAGSLSKWLCYRRPVDLLSEADVASFVAAIQAKTNGDGAALVILDTLAMCLGSNADENSTKDMNAAIQATRRIQEDLGCAVVIVHHTGHDTKRERGSSVLRGAADVMISCSAAKGNMTILRCAKMKDAEPFEPIVVRRIVVEPDDEESSCVVELDGIHVALTDRNESALLDVLAGMMNDNPDGVTHGDWLQTAMTLKGIKTSTFHRARRGLVSRHKVTKTGKGKGARYSPAISMADAA